jgi:hypothetical protein
MKIKTTIFFVIVFAVLGVIILAQSKISSSKVPENKTEECGGRIGDFVLCLETEKSEYALKEPIILQISLKNVSGRKVQLVKSSIDYSLEVKDTNGKSVGYLNNSHSFITQNWISGRNIVEIEPSKKTFKSIRLNDLYDISRIGSYSITTNRRVFDSKGNSEIKSNQINIKIVEK